MSGRQKRQQPGYGYGYLSLEFMTEEEMLSREKEMEMSARPKRVRDASAQSQAIGNVRGAQPGQGSSPAVGRSAGNRTARPGRSVSGPIKTAKG